MVAPPHLRRASSMSPLQKLPPIQGKIRSNSLLSSNSQNVNENATHKNSSADLSKIILDSSNVKSINGASSTNSTASNKNVPTKKPFIHPLPPKYPVVSKLTLVNNANSCAEDELPPEALIRSTDSTISSAETEVLSPGKKLTPVAKEMLHLAKLRQCSNVHCLHQYTPSVLPCHHEINICNRCLGNELSSQINSGFMYYECATCKQDLQTSELKTLVELHVRQPDALQQFREIMRKRQLLKYFGESRLKRSASETSLDFRRVAVGSGNPIPPVVLKAEPPKLERPRWSR